jgi:hypothetical protein
MKLPIFIAILSALSASASAKVLNDDFAYPFLQPAQIGLCPGVNINVNSVGTVGGTYAGGAHGHEIDWTQEMMGRGFMPRWDIRGMIEGRVRATANVNALPFDQSLARTIAMPVALMEQLAVRNAHISACVSRFDMVRVHQIRNVGTDIRYGLGFKIYLSVDSAGGRQTMLVQELNGEKDTRSAFFNLYYNDDPRAQLFIPQSWPVVQNTFDQFLGTVPNAEAESNLEAVKIELGDYIGTR